MRRFGSSGLAAMYRERYWNRKLFDAVARLGAIADQAGLPLPELALRWLLGRDLVDAALVGASSVEQLQRNVAAAERGPLDADVPARCNEVWADLRGPVPAYNR